MVNRERFLLDVDSEGFPQRYDDVPYPPASLAALNVGRSADHAIVQALLADHKCLQCEPVDPVIAAMDYTLIEQRALAWADEHGGSTIEEKLAVSRHFLDVYGARGLVREADQRMDGITRLSDSAAPDAYFGWKS